jgi:hypothetical protein
MPKRAVQVLGNGAKARITTIGAITAVFPAAAKAGLLCIYL